MNKHQRISVERNAAWQVHSLIFHTALIPPKYLPVLTALLTSPSQQVTGHRTAFTSSEGIKGVFLQKI